MNRLFFIVFIKIFYFELGVARYLQNGFMFDPMTYSRSSHQEILKNDGETLTSSFCNMWKSVNSENCNSTMLFPE